jgi:heat shock protein HtpX
MVGEFGSFWQLERVNRRRTWSLVVKMILVLAACGLGLDFLFHTVRFSDGRLSGIPWFTAAAVILAVAQALRANFAGAELVLGALGAHPISSDEPKNQAVIHVVREMALAARIPTPRIDVIDDPSPNAFAIGRDSEHSAICVTQGLLDQMDREELQGVIGHEMAHIRNCDTRLTTMVTAMFGGFGMFSGRLISIMLSREREYLADASAVEFTRNPTALIRALAHIGKTESPLRCATQGTAQLFIVDPFERADSGRSYQQFINEVTRIRS